MAKKAKGEDVRTALTRAEMAEVLNSWIDAHNRDLSMAQAVRKMGELRDSLKS